MNRNHFVAVIALASLLVATLLTVTLGTWLWSLEAVCAIQALGAGLKLPMRIFTFLGSQLFYLMVVPLVYWCIHKTLGADLGALLMLSGVLNGVSKSLIKTSRPFWQDASLRLSDATSFSTPSGHAQSSAALFGYLGWFLARGRWRVWWVIGLALLAILVALSRVYLGVHYPGDVLWGAVVGLGLLALYIWLKPLLLPRLKALSVGVHVMLALVAAALIPAVEAVLLAIPFGSSRTFGALYTDARSAALEEAVTAGGLAFGFWVGLAAENLYVRFSVAGTLWQRVLRYAVGVAGLAALWLGLGAIFPQQPLPLGLGLRAVRSGLAMLWATLIWPWLFVKIGLGARESR